MSGRSRPLASTVFIVYKWLEDQDRENREQLRRDIINEVRAEIYRALLELDSSRFVQTPEKRETLRRLIDDVEDDASEIQGE